MITLDDRPAPPPLPQFSRDMEQFLLDAARTQAGQPASTAPRRRVWYAAAGVAAAGVAAVGVYSATGGGSHAPRAQPTSNQSGGINNLAAFSVDTNPGGTVTLTLTQGQLFDPTALRQALARAGVPAVVTVGSVCTVPGRPSNGLPDVISGPSASNGHSSVTVITPAAIPAGEKLSFGYFAVSNGGGHLFISLVPTHAELTCTSNPPAPPHHGGR